VRENGSIHADSVTVPRNQTEGYGIDHQRVVVVVVVALANSIFDDEQMEKQNKKRRSVFLERKFHSAVFYLYQRPTGTSERALYP
jgi:hypothetical protein